MAPLNITTLQSQSDTDILHYHPDGKADLQTQERFTAIKYALVRNSIQLFWEYQIVDKKKVISCTHLVVLRGI